MKRETESNPRFSHECSCKGKGWAGERNDAFLCDFFTHFFSTIITELRLYQ